jgi:aquaporin Z
MLHRPPGVTRAGGLHPTAIVSPIARSARGHWPEYLIEGGLLALFMISACTFTVLLEHPDSPARAALPGAFSRRVLMGVAMGATAVAIIYSPWGKRSGAHINPATTLTFLRLRKVGPVDAFFYAIAQFAGALAGCLVAGVALAGVVRHPAVKFAVTEPKPGGLAWAFSAEMLIAFILMSVVLAVSNDPRTNRWTGLAAGVCVALFIAFEAPVSGMSMNPARTFGSAAAAMRWDHLWIYFVAPPLGMLAAAEARVRISGARSVLCAKLHHENDHPCIFRCAYPSCGPLRVSAARGGP